MPDGQPDGAGHHEDDQQDDVPPESRSGADQQRLGGLVLRLLDVPTVFPAVRRGAGRRCDLAYGADVGAGHHPHADRIHPAWVGGQPGGLRVGEEHRRRTGFGGSAHPVRPADPADDQVDAVARRHAETGVDQHFVVGPWRGTRGDGTTGEGVRVPAVAHCSG